MPNNEGVRARASTQPRRSFAAELRQVLYNLHDLLYEPSATSVWSPKARTARVAIALVMLGATAVAAGAEWDRYRPSRLKDAEASQPRQSDAAAVTNIALRVRVRYTGAFRSLPDEVRQHIRAWAEAVNAPGAAPLFRKEVNVSEAGVEYWLPVQETVIDTMRAELHPGEEIEAFVINTGQSSGRFIFLVNAFRHEPHR